jgi:hypothetical protein
MSANALTLVSSLMSSIDEVKEKIGDGEYLNICNLLKALNDEIKNPSNKQNQELEEEEAQGPEEDQDIQERISNYWAEYDYNREIMYQGRDFWYLLEGYNNLLMEINNEYENIINAPFFICRCGCSVRANHIREHINSDIHTTANY